MSYTNGYSPALNPCMLIDMRRLKAIREISITDRYVVMETGATWTAMTDALSAKGARLAFNAPFSGIYSAVGSALSQGVPGAMTGVFGLEVVRSKGVSDK